MRKYGKLTILVMINYVSITNYYIYIGTLYVLCFYACAYVGGQDSKKQNIEQDRKRYAVKDTQGILAWVCTYWYVCM